MRALLALMLITAPVAAVAQTATPVPTPLPNVTNAAGTPRAVTPTFPLNVGVTLADCSGTIAAGNTSQQVLAENLRRQILIVENPTDATERLLVDFGRAATLGAVELAPGGTLLLQGPPTPTSTVTVAAATAGRRFICKHG